MKLKEAIIEQINTAARRYEHIEEVILFGSWAMGNAKKGSDIDLAIRGKDVCQNDISSFFAFLDQETVIPNLFDVIHFESINNPDLIDHINTLGIEIYKKDKQPELTVPPHT